ncbi:MAG: hypothetical protein MZV70_45610 [Desulfobacterales bacterium]|nr:hypothetical protein [Desulfobacterales bacterium]
MTAASADSTIQVRALAEGLVRAIPCRGMPSCRRTGSGWLGPGLGWGGLRRLCRADGRQDAAVAADRKQGPCAGARLVAGQPIHPRRAATRAAMSASSFCSSILRSRLRSCR